MRHVNSDPGFNNRMHRHPRRTCQKKIAIISCRASEHGLVSLNALVIFAFRLIIGGAGGKYATLVGHHCMQTMGVLQKYDARLVCHLLCVACIAPGWHWPPGWRSVPSINSVAPPHFPEPPQTRFVKVSDCGSSGVPRGTAGFRVDGSCNTCALRIPAVVALPIWF